MLAKKDLKLSLSFSIRAQLVQGTIKKRSHYIAVETPDADEVY